MKNMSRRKYISIGLIIFAVVIATIGGFLFSRTRFNIIPQIIDTHTVQNTATVFPDINTQDLSEQQQKIIAILKTEYAAQPAGTKYAEGVEEAWCADFVSWVYKEAGIPLSNPNSGSWRIPGTYTLREYYEQEGKFRSADSGYSPKVGDIMLYDNPSPFGQHTNFVIVNNDGIVTTIGGNEVNRIRIVVHTTPDDAGFIGYGVL